MDELLNNFVEHDEGFKSYAYQDSLGFWTIGFGKCIDKRKNCGISKEEALYLLKNELQECELELNHMHWFINLDRIRQEVFIELCFNIGLGSLLEFKQTIEAVQNKDYSLAAKNMLASKWADEVGANRSNNMAQRLITGQYAS